MRLKTTREHRILYIKTAVRWIVYYIVIFLFFTIMTSGTWRKPLILVPVALCIAVNNNQYASAFTGAVCGFLIDISCGKLFGYNAIILTIFCIVVSLLFEFYLRYKFVSFLFVSAVVSYIIISSVFVYLLFRMINHFLMPKTHLTIEETIKSGEQR